MRYILHKSETRGHFNYGWLDTRHTFSFARYNDPERVNFGALRVLNDDIIFPSTGFDMHPHDNMEIITVPIEGSLKHKDTKGHEQIIHENEVQVMSAGTGLYHSEHNASSEKTINLLQIWIYPKIRGIQPAYDQKFFDPVEAKNTWQILVSNTNHDTLMIHQDAFISRAYIDRETSLPYNLKDTSFGCYLFVIDGSIEIGELTLEKRDGVGVYDTDSLTIKAKSNAVVLNIEVPQLS